MKQTVIILLLLTTLFAACQAVPELSPPLSTPTTSTPAPSPLPPTPTASPTRPAPTATPDPVPAGVREGSIRLGIVGRPESLNPILENSSALKNVSPLLFDTLLRVDPQTAELQPGLAREWRYSAAGRQVAFQLPAELAWSDGSPFTAADLVDSLQATRHPALQAFSQISAPDDETIVLDFPAIDCSAVTTLAQLPLIPAAQITETIPTGSGPFTVTEWSEDRETLNLTRNPHYHGNPPFLDQVAVHFFRRDKAEIALYEGLFEAFGPFDATVANPNPELLTDFVYPAPQVIYVAMNYDPRNEAPILPQVRQALVLGLDREAVLAEVLDGEGQLAAGSLTPGHWAANSDLSPPAYDPEAAKALLAQAGLADTDFDGWLEWEGQRMELAIRLNGQNPLYKRLGWLISSYYRELGLFVRAESSAPDSVIDDLFTHDFELAIFSWQILPDPDQRLYWHSTENSEGEGLNFTSFNNPRLDDLLDRGVSMPGCQPEDRAEIYTEAQTILSRDRPVDFLFRPHQHVFVANYLSGPAPGPFAPFTWNIEKWYLTQGD